MAESGVVFITCPRCKGYIEMTPEDCFEPHTLMHWSYGTALRYDPAGYLPLRIHGNRKGAH